MGINASNVKAGKKNFVEQPIIEKGQYPARLVQVIDWGLQPQRAYKGEDKAPAHVINFTFELVDVFMIDEEGNDIEDKPRWVSKEIPLRPFIADLATSTKLAKALDPKDELQGDFSRMLGFPLNLTLGTSESKGKTYTNVLGFAAMRPKDAEKCPPLQNPTKVFDLDNPDLEVFNSLPEWMREKIKGNLEFNQSKLDRVLGGENGVQRVEKKEEVKEAVVEKEAAEIPDESDQDMPW